jgi:hypothetical protein
MSMVMKIIKTWFMLGVHSVEERRTDSPAKTAAGFIERRGKVVKSTVPSIVVAFGFSSCESHIFRGSGCPKPELAERESL